MRTLAAFALVPVLLIAVSTLPALPVHADTIDDETVPGLEPARRAAPMPPMPPTAAQQPAPEPTVVADAMDDEPEPAVERGRSDTSAATHGDPGWRFIVAPYLWLPAINGTTTVDGFSSDLDFSFGDLLDNFDVFALAGRSEAHKDRLGLFLDVLWTKLDGDFGVASAPGFRVKPETEEIKVDFGLMYEAARWETGQGSIALSPLVGGRFTWLKQQVTLRGPVQGRTLGERNTWWEPFVGGRMVWQVSKPFDITIQGDVGGFGVGSDLTWQAAGMFGFRFTDWFKLNMGYYVYDVDWSTGSGRSKQGYDVRQHGPRIGFQFDL